VYITDVIFTKHSANPKETNLWVQFAHKFNYLCEAGIKKMFLTFII
jgi:hypothetical protein